MNKNILAIIIAVVLIIGALFLTGIIETDPVEVDPSEETGEEAGRETDEEMAQFIDCLAENELVIYGAEWCPACGQLVDSLGGYETVDPIYVECTDEGTEQERQRCEEETQTTYVPEIQIAGNLYEGARDPVTLGAEVGCEI